MELFLKHTISNDCSFEEFADWYLKTIAPRGLKEHTIYNTRSLLRNYVYPYIGSIQIREITPVMIDNLLSCLAEDGAVRSERKLSAASIKQIRIAISTVFRTAVQKELIGRNPVALSSKLRVKKKERIFLEESDCKEILLLCDSITNPQTANAIRLLLLTGIRRGELIGLCWKDIDFQRKELYVRRTVSQFGGNNAVTDPKTKNSYRTVRLCDGAIQVLNDQRMIRESVTKDEYVKENESVFTNKNGNYMSGAYLNNCFREMMKNAGKPGFHLHDLRHANASILINNGVPLKLVSEHLGHSSAAVTEEFYTHLFRDALTITANVIEKVLMT